MKKQIVVIHGGDSFDTYEEYMENLRVEEINLEDFFRKGWKKNLAERLGDDFVVIAPRMPNEANAKYLEWKIWFDKIAPFIEDGVILIGHSLGGIFLAKYLSENTFPKKIRATMIVASPYTEISDRCMADFILPESLKQFEKQGGDIFLYYSEDDEVVPFKSLKGYEKDLPEADTCIFKDRGHFGQEEFPEIVAQIKKLK